MEDETYGTRWCPTCRRSRTVVDEHEESRYRPDGEYGYMVYNFDCGHEYETPERRIGAAPGEPYAGPQRAVAASGKPSDRRAARAEQPAPETPAAWL